MSEPSSHDLHPTAGARFAFERLEDDPPRYALTAYLPGARALRAELGWSPDGRAILEPELGGEAWDDWTRDEALKLARVLNKDPKRTLVRWRG